MHWNVGRHGFWQSPKHGCCGGGGGPSTGTSSPLFLVGWWSSDQHPSQWQEDEPTRPGVRCHELHATRVFLCPCLRQPSVVLSHRRRYMGRRHEEMCHWSPGLCRMDAVPEHTDTHYSGGTVWDLGCCRTRLKRIEEDWDATLQVRHSGGELGWGGWQGIALIFISVAGGPLSSLPPLPPRCKSRRIWMLRTCFFCLGQFVPPRAFGAPMAGLFGHSYSHHFFPMLRISCRSVP